jgi:hypothetical protein
MSKASENFLADLHGKLAEALLEQIKSGEMTAAVLNTARQFLRDNGITCDGEPKGPIKEILDNLPSFEDEDIVVKADE